LRASELNDKGLKPNEERMSNDENQNDIHEVWIEFAAADMRRWTRQAFVAFASYPTGFIQSIPVLLPQ
jgi:hypothetical protein